MVALVVARICNKIISSTLSDDLFGNGVESLSLQITCLSSSLLYPGSTKFSFPMQLSASDPDLAVKLPSKICFLVRNHFGVNVIVLLVHMNVLLFSHYALFVNVYLYNRN